MNLKRLLYLLLILLSFQNIFSQLRVIYGITENGQEVKNDSIIIYCSYKSVRIVRTTGNENLFIDNENKQVSQILKSEDKLIGLKKPFDERNSTPSGEQQKINGYNCYKIDTVLRSNKIEIWYTNEVKYYGGPSLFTAGIPGLVMKIVRNGNYEIFAKRVDNSDDYSTLASMDINNVQVVDEADYQRALIDSRFKRYNIFENEIINFSDNLQSDDVNIIHLAKGNIIVKKINLADMITDKDYVIAELTVASNGDAYDRIGSVFAVQANKKNNYIDYLKLGYNTLPEDKFSKFKGIVHSDTYNPPVELIRFITSFGTGFYNNDAKISGYNWKNGIKYKQEITDLIKGLGNEIWLGVFIGNYDKGGHKVDFQLNVYREDDADTIKWDCPLFNTVNMLEAEGVVYNDLFKKDTLQVSVNIPEGLKELKLRYFTTGHGEDEFIQKQNKIFLDDNLIFNVIPWRSDCATYRENNPASGNFPDGTSSSDYSRSNWCPGMIVNPYDIDLSGIKPGKHTFKIVINCGPSSNWAVSGCLIGK